MCWFSNKCPVRRIANRGFRVYKVVLLDETDPEICHGVFFSFDYKYGGMNFTEKIIWRENHADGMGWYSINKGYHSYCNEKDARKLLKKVEAIYPQSHRYKIVRCTIPENSIYYINEKNEVVSSDIIVNRI